MEVLNNAKSRIKPRHFGVFAVLLLCDLKGSKNENKVQSRFLDWSVRG